MKTILSSIFAISMSIGAFAQNNDPILMHINGKPINRSEFEYSYNKNSNIEGAVEHKTIDEYVEMFINYKLKVAAAESMHLDTLSSFKKEFVTYRDLQLKPFLVDSFYIDSVAKEVYKQTQIQLQGKDMLHVAHILILTPQDASSNIVAKASLRIDSIYNELKHGADFSEIAKKYSEDIGTKNKGGELPWIGPGMTLKEFEETAYSLHNDEISKPTKSSVGFHIIKMIERKQLEPYAQLRQQIIAGLKRQGIEDVSAENKIKKQIAASNGLLTREAILDSVMNVETCKDMNLKYLIQEYHDGLLLYEISKRNIWDPASNDKKSLTQIFKNNKGLYTWEEPRFKGFVISAENKSALKLAKKILKKYGKGDWKGKIKKQINKDSVIVRIIGPILVKKGENKIVDQHFGGKMNNINVQNTKYNDVQGILIKKPQDYTDVKSQVETTLQEKLEKQWVEKLRKQFSVTINRNVLSTINKH